MCRQTQRSRILFVLDQSTRRPTNQKALSILDHQTRQLSNGPKQSRLCNIKYILRWIYKSLLDDRSHGTLIIFPIATANHFLLYPNFVVKRLQCVEMTCRNNSGLIRSTLSKSWEDWQPQCSLHYSETFVKQSHVQLLDNAKDCFPTYGYVLLYTQENTLLSFEFNRGGVRGGGQSRSNK